MKTRTITGLLAVAGLAAAAVLWVWHDGRNNAEGGATATRGAEASPASSEGRGAPADPAGLSREERKRAWQNAVEKGEAEAATWPQTPEALIRAFWLAASRKDYQRMTVFCPGSVAVDYKKHYDQWTPSPATWVGPAERHPRNPALTLYPATVPFPGFPKKTIKMAVKKLGDGRLVIDGSGTIWW